MQEDPMLGFNIQIAIDCAPYLILWFFDSRGKATQCIDTCKVLNFNLGGVSQQGVQNKDWVDASVAGWIESETKSMEEAWGPATRRSALAFVHIPPLVSIY